MGYSLSDRMRDMAKAYTKNAAIINQLDKQLTKEMLDNENFRTTFYFGNMNDQRCAPYNLTIYLEAKVKDDYYSTIEYKRYAIATFYIDMDSNHATTISTSKVEFDHYDWISKETFDKFISLLDVVKHISIPNK